MKVFGFLAALLMCVASATKSFDLRGYTFNDYVLEFRKDYDESEMRLREQIFNKNFAKIVKHNSGNHDWRLGVNKFTDMTESEIKQFKGYHKGVGSRQKKVMNAFNTFTFAAESSLEAPRVLQNLKQPHELPESVDWRDHGIVSAVKNQGGCGSCWAFAATATMESTIARDTGLLFNLAPQQIVSCAPNPDECGGTGGCSGATVEIAMQHVMNAGGMVEEYAYGYTSFYGDDGKCQMKNKIPVATIEGFHVLKQNDHLSLLNAVATLGPVAITVDASDWHLYEGGVFNGCNQTHPELDHAVVLVGYGVDPMAGPYWLVRNSWSPAWGEKGYIRLKRNYPDYETCGTDIKPADGVACKGEDEPQHVCGTCGMLFDSVIPLAGKLIDHKIHPR